MSGTAPPWIVLNPETGEGVVNVPDLAPGANYAQTLEWTGLVVLRNEVRRTGGRKDLIDAHGRACEEYVHRWGKRDVTPSTPSPAGP